jgi:hypothetical protein
MQGTLSRYVRVDLDNCQPLAFDNQFDHPSVGSNAFLQGEQEPAPTESARGAAVMPGRLSLRRITKYAAAAAFIVACFIVAEGRSKNSVSTKAFAVALRQLSTADVISYRAEFKEHGNLVRISNSMHLQPDRVREELPDGKVKVIDFSKRRNITLDTVRRTAVVVTDTSHPPNYKHERFLDKVKESIERIRTDPLRTDSYLGKRTVDGRIVEGFEMRKPTQMQTLWVDMNTGLPSEMEIVSLDDPGRSVVMRDFQFNVESYESLFSVDPPPGYEVTFEIVGPAEPLDDNAEMIPH